MNKSNFLIIDTETSGTDPIAGHEITQIAAVALEPSSFEEIPGSAFQCFLKPQFPEKASPEAIEIAKGSWERANKEGIDPKVALAEFNKWCRKWNISGKPWTKARWGGFNTDFDRKMVTYWMRYYKVVNNEEEYEFGNPIDTMGLSFGLFESDPNVKNFKLDTIGKIVGLERQESSHDALEDVRMTAQLFRRIMLFMRRCRSKLKIVANE